jgi:predicted negative regulator of RcsB-dependent stress response
MKKIIFIAFIFSLFVQVSRTQNNPSWAEKAQRAVFSVITYDNEDKLLNNGNGFFISDDGTALSDYTTFKGAKRAVVIGSDGKQMPVSLILGVNELYDIVKFKVAINKKVSSLSLAAVPSVIGSDVYLIPYSTQKNRSCTAGKVKEITKVESKYNYYTFNFPLEEKMVSCPVANANGEVIAISQKSVDTAAASSYGLDTSFGNSLSIGLLGSGDASLKAIGIKKDIPDEEDKALVYLFMAASQYSGEEYTQVLNDFIAKFPNNADGYMRRANNYVSTDKDGSQISLADNDLQTAIKVAKNKDDAYYNSAKLIYAYLQTAPQNPYKAWTLDRAIKEIREAIAINPLPLYSQLEGDMLFSNKNYEEALTAYDKVNHSNMVSAASYYSSAMTMKMLKKDSKDIIAMMDSCIARCPNPITRDMAPYLLERAQEYSDAQMYRPALTDYNAYYESMNGNVNDVFHYYREQAALKAHQYQLALDDIQAAIDSNPNEMLYRVEQGALNLRLNRLDEAIGQLQKAITMNPKYAETYRILGLCYIQQKKNSDACTNFNKAKELGDPNAQAMIDKYCK